MFARKASLRIVIVAAVLIQSLSIIGLKPASAAPVITAAAIDTYLSAKNSPLSGHGAAFVSSGQAHGVDPRLIVAIAGAESGFGRANCQSWPSASIFNAWGYMYWPNGVRTCRPFANWEEAIEVIAWQIGSSTLYFRAGLTTIPSIGARWCGPTCTNWVNNVTIFYTEMGGDLNNLTFAGGTSSNDVVIEEPTSRTPVTVSCNAGWYQLQNNRGHAAYWTLNTNDPAESLDSGEWIPTLSVAGNYRVEAYVPDHAPLAWPCVSRTAYWDSSDARYTIYHANGQTTVVGDQKPLYNQWLDLGTFYFNAGTGGKVKLVDLNGEARLTRTIAFSAMRFISVGTPADTTPPTGAIINPADQSQTGPSSLLFSASASDNSGGSGVKEVNFWIRYANPERNEGGGWYSAGTATAAPYQVHWTTPGNLRSQVMEFGIHVVDQAGNYCIDPSPAGDYTCNNPASKHTVTYLESRNNPNIIENWLPHDLRYYVNQRSLDGDVTQKCFGASAAMVLAMRGLISADYETLKNAANSIYANTSGDLRASAVVAELNNRGLSATAQEYNGQDNGWSKIKQEINAGRPIIFLSAKVTHAGHYFVVVGYRQAGNSRELIVYDPNGKWLGTQSSYNVNTDRFDSYKGQWAYYALEAVWGNYGWPWNRDKTWLITLNSTVLSGASEELLAPTTPGTLPDSVSAEPPTLGIYEGVDVGIETVFTVFLPTVRK